MHSPGSGAVFVGARELHAASSSIAQLGEKDGRGHLERITGAEACSSARSRGFAADDAQQRSLGVRFPEDGRSSHSRGGEPRRSIAIWLILPVVICLSQRLSHACLSTNLHMVKLRMAH